MNIESSGNQIPFSPGAGSSTRTIPDRQDNTLECGIKRDHTLWRRPTGHAPAKDEC